MNRIDFKGYRVDRINDFALEFLDNMMVKSRFSLLCHILNHIIKMTELTMKGLIGSKERLRIVSCLRT